MSISLIEMATVLDTTIDELIENFENLTFTRLWSPVGNTLLFLTQGGTQGIYSGYLLSLV